MKKPAIKVIHRKLGKEQASGLAYKEDRIIHIDSRLKGKEWLEVLIHEVLHCQNPTWSEIKIIGHSKEMSDIIWEETLNKIGI
jgi:hypothetical protein